MTTEAVRTEGVLVMGGEGAQVAPRLLKGDRQSQILDVLRERGTGVRIAELSSLLGVTSVTIRRDIDQLSRHGTVVATRGGVKLVPSNVTTYEPEYHLKLGEESDSKERIARAALAMVDDGSTVFLDGGTTVGAVAKYLQGRNLTIVSNALNVANIIARSPRTRFILIGGTFRPQSHTYLGPQAVQSLTHLRFDIALVGTEGFDPERGLEVPDENDAQFKMTAVAAASRVVVLATSSKLGQPRLFRFASWSDVDDLVTDAALPKDAGEAIRAMQVTVTLA